MPVQRGRISILGLPKRRGTSTLEVAYLLESHYPRSDKERWLKWHNASFRWLGIAEERAIFDADTMYELPNGRYFALKRGVKVPNEWKPFGKRCQEKPGKWSDWSYTKYVQRYKDSR